LLFRRKKTAPEVRKPVTALEVPSASITAASGRTIAAKLTPLSHTQMHSRFGALFLAELRLLLKGQRWWWYVIAAVVITAQFFAPSSSTRILLLIGWLWPILLLSGLGCREKRFDTRQIIFSAPHHIASQLPAAWLSAFVVVALMGLGAFVKIVLAGETLRLLGWLTGVLFIPSLALACGVLTGSSKAFEVLFVLWLYLIFQQISFFDFAGLIPNSSWYYYALVAVVLVAMAVLARRWQLNAKSVK
jgi:hypothetical protein